MDKTKSTQKKNKVLSYVYTGIVALLVVACGITIAFVNAKNTSSSVNVAPTDKIVQVSVNSFVVPVKDGTIAKDYSGSELQYNETLKQWEIHKAIDFIVGEDKKVYAVSDGTVSNVYTNYLDGTVVEISHKEGLISVYKSLSKDVSVSIGDKVNAGKVIGTVDESMAQELKTGAHLHFEMIKNGAKVNPNDYLDLGNK